ncbi:MAG: HNH endonuclease [bacterium]|nr:HNH endonuclease [bacterium]
MDRHPTVPTILDRDDLHNRVIESIRDAGLNVKILDKSPLKLLITSGLRQEEILIYIWNISHGGKTRSPDEYRIQMKGKGLQVGDGFKTLLLGWYDEEKIFVAFSAFKHRNYGRSPSVQVSKIIIQRASEHEVAFQIKQIREGQDIIVAFKPSYIMEYLDDIYPQYHKNKVGLISVREIKAVESPLDIKIPEKEISRVPAPRREIVTTINKKVRETKFQKYIYSLYRGRCAMCGLQARLTEAAHIVAVKDDGSDEISNGVLLCRNHHRAFDLGLLAIDGKYIICSNKNYIRYLFQRAESEKLREFLKNSRVGEKIFLPTSNKFFPKPKYLKQNCTLKGI